MDRLFEALEKRFGDGVVMKQEDEVRDIEVISTGSVSLNSSLGVGGIPKGRITTIFGPEASAKTTLVLEIAGQAIKAGNKVLFIDAEQTLDLNLARAIIGELNENFIVIRPANAEDALEAAEMFIRGDAKLGIQAGEFPFIVLDSVAALSPKDELKKDLDEKTVGVVPRLLGVFLRRNSNMIRKNNIAFVFVNQIRDTINAYGGYNMPGGHALKHFSSVIIYMGSASKIEDKNGSTIGIIAKFTVRKNKVASPFRSSGIPIIFGQGIDYYWDVVEFAKMLGILRMRGSYYTYLGENLGQGLQKTIQFLKDHQQVLDKIVDMCYNVTKETLVETADDEQDL